MAFSLRLPKNLRQAGWTVKIRDGERVETPHVSIMRRGKVWRLSLRDGTFLDAGCKWSEIPKGLQTIVEGEKNWKKLQREWDATYGSVNPISREKDEANDDDEDAQGDGSEK